MDDFRDRVQMLKIQKCLFTDRVGNISVSAEIVPVPVIVILGLLCEVIEKIGAEKVEAPVYRKLYFLFKERVGVFADTIPRGIAVEQALVAGFIDVMEPTRWR